MWLKWRRGVFLVLAAAVLFAGWAMHLKIAQARRETAYRAAMMPFQRDLVTGMSRAAVEKYLDSRKVEYHWESSGGAESFLIEIGKEPGGLVCNPWKVYIELEFVPSTKLGDQARNELDPSDDLKHIKITKLGTCL